VLVGALEHLVAVDAAAVVRDADRDGRAVAARAQREPARFGLSLLAPHLRRLEPWSIALRSRCTIGSPTSSSIERSSSTSLPFDRELHRLADGSRRIADQAREAVEHLPHGHHAARHDLVLQVGHEARRLRDRLG
jgi:hypothetical protein